MTGCQGPVLLMLGVFVAPCGGTVSQCYGGACQEEDSDDPGLLHARVGTPRTPTPTCDPAPLGGGWPVCAVPDISSIQTGPDVSETSDFCKTFKDYNGTTNVVLTFEQIAGSWKSAGLSMAYCAAAVVMAGGECQDDPVKPGCSVKGSSPSGVWQNDWARTSPIPSRPDINLDNPCENAFATYLHIVGNVSQLSDQCPRGCYTLNCPKGESCNTWLSPGAVLRNPPASGPGQPPGAGGSDYKYYNTAHVDGNCGWLGPFCHWQTQTKGGPGYCAGESPADAVSCCAWTGGANSYQPAGFSYYYMQKFLKASKTCSVPGEPDCPACPGNCTDLAAKAFETAQDYCDRAPDV